MISWSNLYLLRYEILINHHKIIWKINKYDSEERLKTNVLGLVFYSAIIMVGACTIVWLKL